MDKSDHMTIRFQNLMKLLSLSNYPVEPLINIVLAPLRLNMFNVPFSFKL